MNTDCPIIRLKPNREISLARGHPWVFSGALAELPKELKVGQAVWIESSSGTPLGTGHYFDGSIAIKVFWPNHILPNADFWLSRLRDAYEYRSRLDLIDNATTTAFRLVNAEGDGFPGLVVDVYNDVAVIQFHSVAMEQISDTLVECLKTVCGNKLKAIYAKGVSAQGSGPEQKVGGRYLFGQGGDEVISENGRKFRVDWINGQKTGFFLDQRDNREFASSISKGRTVLNCFCYSGGFSVAALAGGATSVDSVDSSENALALLAQNISLDFDSPNHQTTQADCLHFLKQIPQNHYDLIVLDPPAFIKHRSAITGGIKGYETINHLALKQIKQQGILLTFSCSQLVSRELFVEIVSKAAIRAGRSVSIIKELSAAPCHPINLFHPEGSYLKGLALRVE